MGGTMEGKRDKDGLTEAEFLASYSDKEFDRPSVTVDIMVLSRSEDFSSLKILLIRRGAHPFLGCWALPGGFVARGETARGAAARELYEETSLRGVYLDQVYTFTDPNRDPRTRVMSIAYLALTPEMAVVCGQDDAAEAAWFDLRVGGGKIEISSVEMGVRILYSVETRTFANGRIRCENWVATPEGGERLAFDHIEIIVEAFLKLRASFEHSDLAFNMAGDRFTLPDLQALYELVLCRRLYKTNFRALVAGRVEPTGGKRKSATSGRMSAEYVYRDALPPGS